MLAGVPYAGKNLFDVQGMVTLAGGKINGSYNCLDRHLGTHVDVSADPALVPKRMAARAVCLFHHGGRSGLFFMHGGSLVDNYAPAAWMLGDIIVATAERVVNSDPAVSVVAVAILASRFIA